MAIDRNSTPDSKRMPSGMRMVMLLLVAATILLLGLELDTAPPLWWDEGWNMTVARNWVELGHYGRLLNGEPVSANMSNGFNVVAPAAVAFRLLGVGTWQGRLPFVLISLATLALTFYLARRLFNRSIAVGTIVVLLLTPLSTWLHPLVMGRVVLGETLALFFLLAGYACFLVAMNGKSPLLLVAIAAWAMALNTKLQVLPFWTLSLLVPMVLALLHRSWRTALLLVGGFAGSLLMSGGVLWLQQAVLHGHTVPGTSLQGLYQITAFVLSLPSRLEALLVAFTFGILSVIGLSYAIWRTVQYRRQLVWDDGLEVTRLVILVLASSWLAWYILLSVGWLRYLYPATYLASMFVAAWFYDLSNGYNFTQIATQISSAVRKLRFDRHSLAALLATTVVVMSMSGSLWVIFQTITVLPDESAQETAQWLNANTPTDALIESYESELFVFLDRPYHFPPDSIQIPLTRRTFLQEDVSPDYDPLVADPDYLVSGPSDRLFDLYTEAKDSRQFRLLTTIGWYTVYERQR